MCLKQPISFLISLLIIVQALHAQTWNGSTSSDWNTASNWTPAVVPDANGDVSIAVAPNQPIINGKAVAKSLTIVTGAAVSINAGGSLSIDGAMVQGILNDGILSNYGNIRLGQNAGAGQYGILNHGSFENFAGASISIDRTILAGLFNSSSGSVVNSGDIQIGQVANAGKNGIQNEGFFSHTGGEIKIDGTTNIGLYSFSGQFLSSAKITIGANSDIGDYGLANQGIFKNQPGGEIQIDRSKICGLYSFKGGMVNEALIAIGSIASVGDYALRNEVLFYNLGTGNIRMDNAKLAGLYNFTGGKFENDGNLDIGTYANTGDYGLLNLNKFNNNAGSKITIDQTTLHGLFNRLGGVFTNTALVNILSSAGESIRNLESIKNNTCATILLNAPLNNTGQFTNNGFLSASTKNPHSNTNLLNDGIIEYPQGNPIPNVTNNDLIAAPISATCSGGLIANALQLGPANRFTISSTWYQDPSLTLPAGIYNQAANLLHLNNPANTLYFSTHDNFYGCDQVVSIQLQILDQIPPTVICRDNTVNLNGSGLANITPADVFKSGSDNCGTVNLQSVTPNAFSCGNIGQTQVILTVNDGHGNTASCNAMVTVKDVTPPVAKCKNTTANLDANGALYLNASIINNGSYDNCSITLNVTPNAFTCANVGLNTVNLQAVDGNGNFASCTAQLTIKDITPAQAKCKYATVTLNDLGQGSLTVAEVNNGSSDACGIATMTLSKTQFNCSEIPGGPQPITLTIKDVHNNTSHCLSSVTVKDAMVPTAICQNTSVQLGVNGTVTVYPADLALDSYDNCSVWSYNPAAKVYTSANLGANNLLITVKDWSGNSATCTSIVTVLPHNNMNAGNTRDQHSAAISTDFDFNVYPNPTSGATTLSFVLPAEMPLTIQVINIAGQQVFSQETTGQKGENTLPMQLTGIPSGVYLLEFQAADLKVQKRLMVQK